jgi:hypothetical protein
VCKYCPSLIVGNIEVIYLLVSNMDATQLFTLTTKILCSEFVLFGKNLGQVIGIFVHILLTFYSCVFELGNL